MKKLTYLSFKDAYNLGLASSPIQKSTQIIFLQESLYRVLAEDIIVQKNLPSFDNAAMDGFAFKHIEKGQTLNIVSTIFAGDIPSAQLTKGSCYKIMTGAQVPPDADTIVPIEHCSNVTAEHVTIPSDIKLGNAFRSKGEEQKVGNVLCKHGEQITPAHIALLAAQGIVSVNVYKPLDIAVVSTGDEIKEPWETASEDEIYNANAFALRALLQQHGFEASYIGAIPDSLEKSSAFIESLKAYDVIITTGGISMGEADFLEEAFLENGLEVLFHGIELKPGRSTMMGRMDNTFVMAMPGNPLAAMLNTFILSLPILSKMQGNINYHHRFVYAKNRQKFKVRAGRTDVVLGTVEEGAFIVTRNNTYGSGMLTPMVESNAFVILDEEISMVEEGKMLKVIVSDSFPNAIHHSTINEIEK